MSFDKFLKHGAGQKAMRQQSATQTKPKACKERRRQPAWVGVWSCSLQDWITIHGRLPAGYEKPPSDQPAAMLAVFNSKNGPAVKR